MKKQFLIARSTPVFILLQCFIAIIFTFPRLSFATPLNDLLLGGEYQVDNLKFSNWQLVTNHHVNTNQIQIDDTGPYSASGIGVYSTGPNSNSFDYIYWGIRDSLTSDILDPTSIISFDYMVSGIGVDISQVNAVLGMRGYKGYSGYMGTSPWGAVKIEVGTSQGSNDLGSTKDYFTYNNFSTKSSWINIPTGIDQLWVRDTISFKANRADVVFLGGKSGGIVYPAVLNRFKTTQAPAPVPEPATMLLFGTGLAGLVGSRVRRKKSNEVDPIVKTVLSPN